MSDAEARIAAHVAATGRRVLANEMRYLVLLAGMNAERGFPNWLPSWEPRPPPRKPWPVCDEADACRCAVCRRA